MWSKHVSHMTISTNSLTQTNYFSIPIESHWSTPKVERNFNFSIKWSFCWQELLFNSKNMRNFSAKQKINKEKRKKEPNVECNQPQHMPWLIDVLLCHYSFMQITIAFDIFIYIAFFCLPLVRCLLDAYALCVVLLISI